MVRSPVMMPFPPMVPPLPTVLEPVTLTTLPPVADPVVLLMDEPFAALDAQTREFMQAELLKIWSEARKKVLFITHPINEAVYLSDRVAVMSARPGRIKGIVQVPFERPRALGLKRDPRFLKIEETIWQMVDESPERIGMTKAAG